MRLQKRRNFWRPKNCTRSSSETTIVTQM
ncbi:BnaCnng49230D [Brassica napus]|uniref:BnaCnng49230D protein n=1 Tax=Brassica napus TaxID=3708 RepID=A0A078JJJ5_BRANA|nr:BnaCnng49230D [Brassica napus]